MARSAAIPLAIAGFGSLILVSGIEGQSLSEIIKGEIGKGKNPLSPTGKSSGTSGAEPIEPGVAVNPTEVPIGGSNAKGPSSVELPPNIPPGKSSQYYEAAILKSRIERAESFRLRVKKEVESGTISTRTGSEKFFHRFPHYESEVKRFGKLLKELGIKV